MYVVALSGYHTYKREEPRYIGTEIITLSPRYGRQYRYHTFANTGKRVCMCSGGMSKPSLVMVEAPRKVILQQRILFADWIEN